MKEGQTEADAKLEAATVKHVDISTEHTHLVRRFSALSCLGMAFAMLNSWTGKLQSFI